MPWAFIRGLLHTHTHTHKRDPYINRMIIVLNIVGAMKFVQNTHTHTHTHTHIYIYMRWI